MFIFMYFFIFNSFYFYWILHDFDAIDVIQGGLKPIFRLHGKNMSNYTQVEISTLLLRQGWNNHRAEISARFNM